MTLPPRFRNDRLGTLFCAAALASLVSACGGSDDSSTDADGTTVADAVGSPASMPAAQSVTERDAEALRWRPRPPRTPAPAPAPAPVAGTCGLADFQATALTRIHQLRAAPLDCRSRGRFAATTPLAWNARLAQAALGHSQEMAALNYFSHTSADGRSMVDRIEATGYAWSALGENIAAGYPSVNAVIDGWIASDGHCANLMNPAFRDVALVCVQGTPSSAYRTYWTMDLGKPR